MKYKKIHFVGIKGVGMTPLAIIAKEAGFEVSGSDIKDSFITDQALKEAGIVPFVGFATNHIRDVYLVITTGAHEGFSNIEVLEARKKKITIMTQGEAVGAFMERKFFGRSFTPHQNGAGFTGISVAGTHGKTTTTAMVATILEKNGLDPSYVIGTGWIPSLGAPGHFGEGKYFVAEADEYVTEPNFDKTAKFLWQHPKIAIFTNIEFDHPDAYKSVDEIRNAFLKFANQLPQDGLLIACGDSLQVRKLLREYKGIRLTYGLSKENDFVISEIQYCHSGYPNEVGRLQNQILKQVQDDKQDSGHQAELGQGKLSLPTQNDKKRVGLVKFKIARKNQDLGEFTLSVFGNHNVLNATASIVTSLELGIPIDKVQKALLEFIGSKRRSEYIGQLYSGARLYDDYAHHPTKIQATLAAFKSRFPKSKIVCIFQPHTYSRTKSLFEQFIHSFNDTDAVIITDIYASLRERKDTTISSKDLVDRMKKFKKGALFISSLDNVVEYINKKGYGEDTIVITMGAGDIYKINSKLKTQSSKLLWRN